MKNASTKSRLLAFLIDGVIVTMILSLVSFIYANNKSMINLNNELSTLSQNFLNNKIELKQFYYNYAEIIKQLDMMQALLYIINCAATLVVFVIVPFKNNGQTIGCKLCGIKIVNEDDTEASINSLIFRNIIINNLAYYIILLATVFVLPSFPYLVVLTILNIIQNLVVLVSIFMILYRKDKKGLQDLLTKTKVVECK